jgi:putative PIN family toxin of toxin-antitoxin system
MPAIVAIFDTNTFLQAVLSDSGPARACVDLLLAGKVRLVFTKEIENEVLGVVARLGMTAKYPQLRDRGAGEFIRAVFEQAILLPQPYAHFRLQRDEADEVFINLAIDAPADYIVTRDRDLLDLTVDSEFCSRFPGLKIVTPVGFLEAIRSK